MKIKRQIIEIDEKRCTGCGNCVTACAEGAIAIINGKAKVIKESLCDGLGACIGNCPEHALRIIEREADEFDPDAIERGHQKQGPIKTLPGKDVLPCGCPSTHIQIFGEKSHSFLTHWPVQIRLVSHVAPFLKDANMLIAADCTPVAYPDFHRDFLNGKVCLIGCPKFDDTELYRKKFAEIFKTFDIKSVTILIMEVPCCSKLPVIIKEGMNLADKKIPLEIIKVMVRGGIETIEKE
ncbi:MAG TPA: 4Fe-4S binding protein [Syntrophorhabdaceae bacterium]|nr:4Fe-4S binding protein [Syntrophorhabdaceae bacterium]